MNLIVLAANWNFVALYSLHFYSFAIFSWRLRFPCRARFKRKKLCLFVFWSSLVPFDVLFSMMPRCRFAIGDSFLSFLFSYCVSVKFRNPTPMCCFQCLCVAYEYECCFAYVCLSIGACQFGHWSEDCTLISCKPHNSRYKGILVAIRLYAWCVYPGSEWFFGFVVFTQRGRFARILKRVSLGLHGTLSN